MNICQERPPAETTGAQSPLAQPEEGSTPSLHLTWGGCCPRATLLPLRPASVALVEQRQWGHSWHCEQDTASVLQTWQGCPKEGSWHLFNFSLLLREKKKTTGFQKHGQNSSLSQQAARCVSFSAGSCTHASNPRSLIQPSRKQTSGTAQHPALDAPARSGTKPSAFGISAESSAADLKCIW